MVILLSVLVMDWEHAWQSACPGDEGGLRREGYTEGVPDADEDDGGCGETDGGSVNDSVAAPVAGPDLMT